MTNLLPSGRSGRRQRHPPKKVIQPSLGTQQVSADTRSVRSARIPYAEVWPRRAGPTSRSRARNSPSATSKPSPPTGGS